MHSDLPASPPECWEGPSPLPRVLTLALSASSDRVYALLCNFPFIPVLLLTHRAPGCVIQLTLLPSYPSLPMATPLPVTIPLWPHPSLCLSSAPSKTSFYSRSVLASHSWTWMGPFISPPLLFLVHQYSGTSNSQSVLMSSYTPCQPTSFPPRLRA